MRMAHKVMPVAGRTPKRHSDNNDETTDGEQQQGRRHGQPFRPAQQQACDKQKRGHQQHGLDDVRHQFRTPDVGTDGNGYELEQCPAHGLEHETQCYQVGQRQHLRRPPGGKSVGTRP
jgi:hypothetical protein